MPMLLFSFLILFVALYGYFLSIKKTKLENEIRKNNQQYECFKCKENFSVDQTKCPKCNFITLYGQRKKKFWIIIPIILTWLFMLAKFSGRGMF